RIVRQRKALGHFPNPQRRGFRHGRGYHLITPFCQTSTRSRTLKSNVMIVEKKAAIITSAAKTFPYSAQPWAQATYQPRPDFTPTVSATTSVRNDAPNPMKSPMKMLGSAAGIATRKIR